MCFPISKVPIIGNKTPEKSMPFLIVTLWSIRMVEELKQGKTQCDMKAKIIYMVSRFTLSASDSTLDLLTLF